MIDIVILIAAITGFAITFLGFVLTTIIFFSDRYKNAKYQHFNFAVCWYFLLILGLLIPYFR